MLICGSYFQNMYAVVLFVSENEVELLPKSWVTGEKCRWPQHMKSHSLTEAIKSRLPPETDWETYVVKVLIETGR